jgi:hypothetical protein
MPTRDDFLYSKPTVYFRPEDRTSASHPTYWQVDEFGNSYIGFIETAGSHELKQPPVLHKDVYEVEVIDRITKKLSQVTKEELDSSFTQINSQEALLIYLQQKYPSMSITQNSVVTVYQVRYSDSV